MLNDWSEKQKMMISQTKTKAMVIHYTKKYQFGTRLQLKGENIELVDKMKILGTIFTNQLSWDDNCDEIVRKVNMRMQLLHSIWKFGISIDQMVHLWKTFCLSVLEQSCVIWHGSLTKENNDNLERTQKTFCKLVLRKGYINYEQSLLKLNLLKLSERREEILINFAKKSIVNKKLDDLFPLNTNTHNMKTRKKEKYLIEHCNNDRLKNSTVFTMRRLLNTEDKINNKSNT